jgi:outer membrane lipoprotein carrier protein
MRSPQTLLLACAVLLLAPGAALGGGDADGDGCLDAALSAVQARYDGIEDLAADFVQVSRSVVLAGSAHGDATTSSGRVVFARPGRMRWEYLEPEPSLTVSDGETLWIYDPGRHEAQRMTLTGGYFSGAAVQFLVGKGDLRRDFEVRELACSEDAADIELVPRNDASYERIRLRVEFASGEVRQTSVVDLLGNVTQVTFSDIEANRKPDADVFEFDPPEGVEVIDLDAP